MGRRRREGGQSRLLVCDEALVALDALGDLLPFALARESCVGAKLLKEPKEGAARSEAGLLEQLFLVVGKGFLALLRVELQEPLVLSDERLSQS